MRHVLTLVQVHVCGWFIQIKRKEKILQWVAALLDVWWTGEKSAVGPGKLQPHGLGTGWIKLHPLWKGGREEGRHTILNDM